MTLVRDLPLPDSSLFCADRMSWTSHPEVHDDIWWEVQKILHTPSPLPGLACGKVLAFPQLQAAMALN